MAEVIDARLFRKAKRANVALQFTETELIVPAKADKPEIRVRLPNRREKTFEEREAAIAERQGQIAALEEEIEAERKELKAKVDAYRALGTGGSEVVVQNLKIKTLMERRNTLARPEKWAEEVARQVGPNEIFLEKHKIYSLDRIYRMDFDVVELVRRPEALASLYVDVGLAAAAEQRAQEEAEGAVLEGARAEAAGKSAAAAEKARAATELPGAPDAAAAARTGAIVGQRRVITLGKKKTAAAGGAAGGAPGGI